MNSCPDLPKEGLPHSDIRGSTIARISPRLFAACHVLHRLLAPRHPPNALLALVTNSSARTQYQTAPKTQPSTAPNTKISSTPRYIPNNSLTTQLTKKLPTNHRFTCQGTDPAWRRAPAERVFWKQPPTDRGQWTATRTSMPISPPNHGRATTEQRNTRPNNDGIESGERSPPDQAGR
jgi:hypothetical protein